MNRWMAVLLSLVCSVCAYGQQRPAAPSASTGQTDTFAKLENDFTAAIQHKDKAALEGALAPDFTMTFSFAPDQSLDRDTYLQGALTLYNLKSFAIRGLRVRQIGDVAIVSSVYQQQAEMNGNDRGSEFFVTDVWTHKGDRWLLSARYSSKVEGPPGAAPPKP